VNADDLVRAAKSLQPSRENNFVCHAQIRLMAKELALAWTSITPGIQTFSFAHGSVRLILAIGHADLMLPGVECRPDVVFLDGFSHRVNPDMWSLATLREAVRHCRPGAALATYTVAKSVRQILAQLGFSVHKCKGLPPKRDRLEAVYVGCSS